MGQAAPPFDAGFGVYVHWPFCMAKCPYCDFNSHLVKVAVQAALGHRPHLDIFGTDYATPDGSCVRDYIHVTDLASAHVDALAHLRRGGDSMILNCGYGRGFSVLEVVDVVKKVTGTNFPTRLGPRRPGDPATIVASPERIRAALGWVPQHEDLAGIVESAFHWERKLKSRNA
jgi:UDP-glucose 4-epimerase